MTTSLAPASAAASTLRAAAAVVLSLAIAVVLLPGQAQAAGSAAGRQSGASNATETAQLVRVGLLRGCVTRTEFGRLTRGMTRAQVRAVVGSRGIWLRGDIGLQVRAYRSCVATGMEYPAVCLGFTRIERADGTWAPARLRYRHVDCGAQ